MWQTKVLGLEDSMNETKFFFSKTLPGNGETREEINRYVIFWWGKGMPGIKNTICKEECECRQDLRKRWWCYF